MTNGTDSSSSPLVNTVDSTPSVVIITTPFPASHKLNRVNFPQWRSLVTAILNGHDLLDYVTGDLPPPDRSASTYKNWFRQDQSVYAFLQGSLTDEVSPYITASSSSAEAWAALHSIFASKSRSRVMQLKADLQQAKQGTKSVSEFVHFLKSKADELSLIESPMSDDDFTLYVLGGLHPKFRDLAASIRAQNVSISFVQLLDLLVAQEKFLDAMDNPQSDLTISANFTQQRPPKNSGRGGNSNRGRGGASGRGRGRQNHQAASFQLGNSSITCQLCNRTGHIARNCWQFTITANPPNVNAARSPIPQHHPNAWLLDSGATHNLNGLSLHSEYDGSSLPITHTGRNMAESSSVQEEVAISIRDGDIKEAGPPRRRSGRRRVPVPLRENEKQKHIYDPVTVPLGPYHHGRRQEFHLVEQLKEEVLGVMCGDRDRALPLSLVSERLPEIRQFYGGADGYGDGELAAMMVRDTCFVLCFIMGDRSLVYGGVGLCGSLFMWRDLFMLENQIPLWLISLLTPFAGGHSRSHCLNAQLHKFLVLMITGSRLCSMETTSTALPWVNDGELPLHLLEASQRLLVPSSDQDSLEDLITGHEPAALLFNNNMFRSATDLKAKGIHLRPSSHSLTDISFSSFSTYGQLHLPVFSISDTSRVLLSNLVAYELTSDGCKDLGVIRYVGLMKTLLRGEEDVELLREKDILYSELANGEVVKLFQDIDTCGQTDQTRLNDVKKRIEEHCKNNGKTWLAELINTYFRSPLTAIALFAAAFILVLTFLQTFYTIKS